MVISNQIQLDFGVTSKSIDIIFPLAFTVVPVLVSNCRPEPWSGSSSNISYTKCYRVSAYHKGVTETGFTSASDATDSYTYIAIGY